MIYVGITMREPETAMPLQAVNRRCVHYRYRLAWIVVRGKQRTLNLRRIVRPV